MADVDVPKLMTKHGVMIALHAIDRGTTDCEFIVLAGSN